MTRNIAYNVFGVLGSGRRWHSVELATPMMKPASAVVLIVEDEPLIRMAAVDLIEGAGFEAVEAANADEAIEILEQRTDVRIVFTDIDMPGSMDGLKLAIAVRGRWPPVEIIITSGHRSVQDKDLPARSVFMPKPYSDDDVVATLRRMAA